MMRIFVLIGRGVCLAHGEASNLGLNATRFATGLMVMLAVSHPIKRDQFGGQLDHPPTREHEFKVIF